MINYKPFEHGLLLMVYKHKRIVSCKKPSETEYPHNNKNVSKYRIVFLVLMNLKHLDVAVSSTGFHGRMEML